MDPGTGTGTRLQAVEEALEQAPSRRVGSSTLHGVSAQHAVGQHESTDPHFPHSQAQHPACGPGLGVKHTKRRGGLAGPGAIHWAALQSRWRLPAPLMLQCLALGRSKLGALAWGMGAICASQGSALLTVPAPCPSQC